MNGPIATFFIVSGVVFWAMLILSTFVVIAVIRAAVRSNTPTTGPSVGDEFEQWLKDGRPR